MENIIVGLIVAAAAAFVVYRFFGKKNRGKCGCGCSGCAEDKAIKIDKLPAQADEKQASPDRKSAPGNACQRCSGELKK